MGGSGRYCVSLRAPQDFPKGILWRSYKFYFMLGQPKYGPRTTNSTLVFSCFEECCPYEVPSQRLQSPCIQPQWPKQCFQEWSALIWVFFRRLTQQANSTTCHIVTFISSERRVPGGLWAEMSWDLTFSSAGQWGWWEDQVESSLANNAHPCGSARSWLSNCFQHHREEIISHSVTQSDVHIYYL
jgi:hypothetical protein